MFLYEDNEIANDKFLYLKTFNYDYTTLNILSIFEEENYHYDNEFA